MNVRRGFFAAQVAQAAMLIASFSLGLNLGCTSRVPNIELKKDVQKTAPAAVVLFVDGMDRTVFWRLQREGKLPNITRHFIDGGVSVENASDSLPTITYANNASFLTGVFPGHHDITGNRWFDRYRLLFGGYETIPTYRQVNGDLVAPTIYEMLDRENTCSIASPIKRGATRSVDNWLSMGIAWYFRLDKSLNQLGVVRLEEVSETANSLGRWPTLIFTYFPTSDTAGHRYGPQSEQYAANLMDIDKCIGQFFESLRRAGLYDTTYRVLVTDHGMVSVDPKNVFPVETFLQQLGVETRSQEFGEGNPYEQRASHFNGARAVVVSDGGRCSHLHLRSGEFWFQRPTSEEIDGFARNHADMKKLPAALRQQVQELTFPQLLARQAGVSIVAMRDGDSVVRVMNSAGSGRVTRRITSAGKEYRYERTGGEDPLGQAQSPQAAALMDGQFHSSRQWQEAGFGTDCPDTVPQLPEMFDSARTGDLMLFSSPGWSFTTKQHGAHGGLTAEEIHVPLFFGGPGVPQGGTIPFGRTVDITPTVLGLLGESDRFTPICPADGIDLSSQLRAAKPGAGKAVEGAAGAKAVETAPAN